MCAALLVPSASALAVRPPGPDRIAVKDTRQAARTPSGRTGVRPATVQARSALVAKLGRTGVVDLDARTGTVRQVMKVGGALTAPSGAARATIVRGWLRGNATALGLDAADVDGLDAPTVTTAPGALSIVRFRQSVKGIPTFAGGVKAGVDRAGRLVSVSGSPIHALSLAGTTPALTPARAIRALADEVGGRRVPAVRATKTDARRSTTFASGDMARLVLFGSGAKQRLAWHLTYEQSANAWWDAVVDARTGAVLYRQNLVRHAAAATIYPNYPGAPAGGSPTGVDLEALGYLPAGASILDGPFAHAYADVNGNNQADGTTEEVERSGGSFVKPLVNTRTTPSPRCEPTAICTWNSSNRQSSKDNQDETTVQAFWFNGNWHDHLKAQPIGFDAASGNFEGADKVRTETDDTIDPTDGGDPQLNNANMATPPDGQPPRMQMYLGAYDTNGAESGLGADGGAFRDYNNSDDAATVYHEYTHGLSNRLVTFDDGSGALSSPQSGAMGEAWSDWYAFDYLVRQGLSPDTTDPGEVDIGIYSDAFRYATRFQALDCPVRSPDTTACPGGAQTASTGGFTYADFGKVCCGSGARPEVHSDGEIWSETLWDLRTALGTDSAGLDLVEQLVTNAMRLSPPEPSFLDMRNSILQADVLLGGAHQDAIWNVFAARGMGYFASAADGNDVQPVADLTTPAAAAALPKGSIAGRVTDADTHKPLSGVAVGIGGLNTPGFSGALSATTGADGRYTITGLPQHSYPNLSVTPSTTGYFPTALTNVTVTGGSAVTRDVAVRKSLVVGAPLTATDTTGDEYACGPKGLTDANLGSVWELDLVDNGNDHAGYQASAQVDLGRPVDVYGYAVDPSEGCGAGAAAAARDYKLEASADGQTWSVVSQGTFPDGAGLTELPPTAQTAKGMRYVRLTVTADDTHAAYGFLDVSELAVFAHATPAGGSLTATPASIKTKAPVTLTASGFTTDPRASIVSYGWDLDADGKYEQITTTPTTTAAYSTAGTYRPRVVAVDDLGGAGAAQVASPVTVGGGTVAPPKRAKLGYPKAPTRSARFKVSCDGTCRVSASLVLSKHTAKKLGRKFRAVAKRKTTTVKGTRTFTLRVSKTLVRQLKRHHMRSVKAALRVTVRQSGLKTVKKSKTVRVRR